MLVIQERVNNRNQAEHSVPLEEVGTVGSQDHNLGKRFPPETMNIPLVNVVDM